MKIVFLDAATIGADVSFDELKKLGDVVLYDGTLQEEAAARIADCDIAIVNKVKLFKKEIDAARNLKLICVAATGINCVDAEYAALKGIPVKNIPAYSTESVVQVIMMDMLNLVGHGIEFNEFVHSGKYSACGMFSDLTKPFFELKGKKLGIIGMGNIGSRLAQIAATFGMMVSYFSTSGTNHCKEYPSVPLEQLLVESDIVSVNCPMNKKTNNLIDYEKMKLMKRSAYLINASRGGIVNEAELVAALNDNLLAGAAIDAYEVEPIPPDHPYLSKLKDKSKLILTPHIGWTSREARAALLQILIKNIKEFLQFPCKGAGSENCSI